MHPPQFGRKMGVVSYSPNVVYLAHLWGGVAVEGGFLPIFLL